MCPLNCFLRDIIKLNIFSYFMKVNEYIANFANISEYTSRICTVAEKKS